MGDGRGTNPTDNPHNLTGDPQVNNLGLLSIDANADGTPDVLDSLNDRDSFPNTEAAILYAKQQMADIFRPAPGSPLIDAGVDLQLGLLDILGNGAVDHPATPNPWQSQQHGNQYPGHNHNGDGTGLFDMGPIEFLP